MGDNKFLNPESLNLEMSPKTAIANKKFEQTLTRREQFLRYGDFWLKIEKKFQHPLI